MYFEKVSRVFQNCFKDVLRMFQRSCKKVLKGFNKVFRKLQGSSRVFHLSFKGFSRVFQRSFNGFSAKFQGYFKRVFKVISWKIKCCFISVSKCFKKRFLKYFHVAWHLSQLPKQLQWVLHQQVSFY